MIPTELTENIPEKLGCLEAKMSRSKNASVLVLKENIFLITSTTILKLIRSISPSKLKES